MRGMWSLRRLASIPLAVAALSPDVSAGPSGRPAVRVGIVLGGRVPDVARHVPAMLSEANAIWRPRGVVLALVDEKESAPGDLRLTLTFAPIAGAPSQIAPRPGGRASEGRPGLGSIWFYEDGKPGDAIALDPRAIRVRLSEVRINGRPIEDWPPSVVDQAMGRALGRVLAHELGHYLLSSTAHAMSGLMRAAFNGPELAGWDRGRFVLDAGAIPRLQARLARLESARDPLVAGNPSR